MVEDAEVGRDRHAGLGGSAARDLGEVIREGLDGPAVVVGSHEFIAVSQRVPVPAETDHVDPHLGSATHGGAIETGRRGADGTASVDEAALSVEVEKVREMGEHGES